MSYATKLFKTATVL